VIIVREKTPAVKVALRQNQGGAEGVCKKMSGSLHNGILRSPRPDSRVFGVQ